MSRNGIGQREVRSVVDALKRFAPEIEISQGAFRSSRNRTFCISHFENRTFRISHFAKPDTLRVPADQVSDCPRRQTLSGAAPAAPAQPAYQVLVTDCFKTQSAPLFARWSAALRCVNDEKKKTEAMHSITQTGQRPSKLTVTSQLHLGSACDVHTRSPAAISGSRAPPVSLAEHARVATLKSEAY